jgi:hypothetical protein
MAGGLELRGHEQAGIRPVVIISTNQFNRACRPRGDGSDDHWSSSGTRHVIYAT